VAINSVIFNLARFLGPMLAGLAIVWSGISAAFAANALSYVVFRLALTRVSVDVTDMAPARRRSLAADLREGISYTATHPAIAALLVLLIAIGIGGRPLNDLLPGFAAEVFRSGAGGLSLLASATGAGAILGGLWLGHRVDSSSLTRVAIGASAGGAIAAAGVAATDRIWLAIPAIMAFGFCVSSAGIAIQTLVQLSSDRNMRGRVMGLYGLSRRGVSVFRLALAGPGGRAHRARRMRLGLARSAADRNGAATRGSAIGRLARATSSAAAVGFSRRAAATVRWRRVRARTRHCPAAAFR
jgi:predicted MFS family arabinose efflux permease